MNKRVLEVPDRTAWIETRTKERQRRERCLANTGQTEWRRILYWEKWKTTGADWTAEHQSTITTTTTADWRTSTGYVAPYLQ